MARLSKRERSLAARLGNMKRDLARMREERDGYLSRLWRAKKQKRRVSPFYWVKGTATIHAPDLVARVETAQLLGLNAELEAKNGELHLFFVEREDA